MPWKNGGGVTTEIAVDPPLASVADFDWRISMATVASDGPFSRFDGIDRTLTVLNGEGLELEVEGETPVRLTPAGRPYPFPGDATASAKLIAGSVTDFNVMTRRGRWTHSVDNLSIDGTQVLPIVGNVCIIFCRTGEIILDKNPSENLSGGGEKCHLQPALANFRSGSESSALEAHDAALIDASADSVAISIGGSGEAIIVHLSQTLSAE
ncbi:HutD family protein [Phyllobacterium zundukense]|uniref:HutD family protein n=1 Tax=Phyllobacterium zundukense TaxID=1867719 RepID=A0ACD4DA46_9HYPH|nr:HutD family protein [Phyllobacterium zundukense]UXN62619.1 HutD family protein [Phyllobacterium zundukense]